MTNRAIGYAFLALAVILAIASSIGFGVYARTEVWGHTSTQALADYSNSVRRGWIGTVFLFLPFIYLAWIGAFFARRRSLLHGVFAFSLGAAILVCLNLYGSVDSQVALKREHWTASALSAGLPSIGGIVLLSILLIAGAVIWRPRRDQPGP